MKGDDISGSGQEGEDCAFNRVCCCGGDPSALPNDNLSVSSDICAAGGGVLR